MPGYVEGTDLTPDGSLYTGWAELAFRFGPHLRPADGANRELLDGRFPVIRYFLRSGSVAYTVTVFSAAVGERPVNFVRVALQNRGRRAAEAGWAAGLRYAGGAAEANGRHAFRFPRPAQPSQIGFYTQPGVAFDPRWRWAFADDAVTRDGQALVLFPRPPRGLERRLRLLPTGHAPVTEGSIFGSVSYRGLLAPGASRQLDFAMPVVPVTPGTSDYRAVADARIGSELHRTIAHWRALYARTVQIQVPEPKVQDTFYASLANMAVARYPSPDGGWVQTVNKLQYNAFWLRDGAMIVYALDLAGLHDLAAQDLDFFTSWQQPDGLFISRSQQYDGFGEALWAICRHAVTQQDLAFAQRMQGPVESAIGWFESEQRSEPWGLMPASTPGDDELTTGHITGDDFWAADGIGQAIAMARLLGRADLVARWSSDLGAFMERLRMRLAAAEAKTGGWIPPALEANGGQDWGNLWAAYPEPVLTPTDPAVTATIRHVRLHFREGIATYYDGTVLHDYLGFRVFETELERGEQRAVVAGLYSELAHTTATNAGFELGVTAHGRRVLTDDLAPHGWFAAEYVALLRNMLVREQGARLVLMGAVSPLWLEPGRRIVVRGAGTARGRISYVLDAFKGGAALRWHAQLLPGTELVWPVPAASRAVRTRDMRGGLILLHGSSGRLRVRWRVAGPIPSFDATAKRVMAQYRNR